jgi:hypothetical protein
MAEKQSQTLANHARLDPAFHLFLFPLTVVLVVWQAVRFARHPAGSEALFLLLTIALAAAVIKMRLYALKVQDRVIRLEEQVRLGVLLPPELAVGIPRLSESQLIALRFACDAELPALARRTLEENLTNKQIKQAITVWRPDYWRV